MKKSVKKNSIAKKAIVVGMTLAISASLFAGCGSSANVDGTNNTLKYDADLLKAFNKVETLNANDQVVSQSAVLDGSQYQVTVVKESGVEQYTLDSSLSITDQSTITNSQGSETSSETSGESSAVSSSEASVQSPDSASSSTSNSTSTETKPSEEVVVSDFEKAYNEAIKLAGVVSGDIVSFDFDKDNYMGQSAFEVEIKTATAKYEYIFKADDMSVLESKIKLSNSNTESTTYIDEAKAIEIALATVGQTDQTAVENFRLISNKNGGARFYKVRFTLNDYNYEIKVDALDGTVVKFEKEITKQAVLDFSVENSITSADVEQIVKDFIADETVEFKKIKLDYEDGKFVFEVDAKLNDVEYEIEVDAQTGEILDCDINDEKVKEDKDDKDDEHDDDDEKLPSEMTFITEEDAIAKVMATINDETAFVTKVEVERKNSKTYFYEIEVIVANEEKEFMVDAIDGTVTEKEAEKEDDKPQHGKPEFVPGISEQEALNIALDKYTLKNGETVVRKIKLNEEKGIYEVKFSVNDIDYNFEINCQNGKIESHQKRFD